MSLENFISWCIDNSISFTLESDHQLKVHAAPGKLTEDVIQDIRHYKFELIDWIRQGELQSSAAYVVPDIAIPKHCTKITPDMLPLISLSQRDIDHIVSKVPGGVTNIKDMYPLAPLQEGMLFHHTVNEDADPHVSPTLLRLADKEAFDKFVQAMTFIVDRYDVLRTAIFWRNHNAGIQVVLKKVELPLEFLDFCTGTDVPQVMQDLCEKNHQSLDLEKAPLMRLQVAADPVSGQYFVFFRQHHLIVDHVAFEIIYNELATYMAGQQHLLPAPCQYREFVAQVLYQNKHLDTEAFFTRYLGDVTDPTIVFGLLETSEDRRQVEDISKQLPEDMHSAIKAVCRSLQVNAAAVFHAAWALVVARFVGREDVVFGTVMSGRLLGGADMDNLVGMTINTIPYRSRIAGMTAAELVRQSYSQMHALLPYEQVSLADAQSYSQVRGGIPLFNSLMNYRHTNQQDMDDFDDMLGIKDLGGSERNSYPITLSVDDFGTCFGLSAKTDKRLGSDRVIAYMMQSLDSLLSAIQTQLTKPAISLDIMPPAERQLQLIDWNQTSRPYPCDLSIHSLFEQQVAKTPDHLAVQSGDQSLTFAELNARANRLAHYLQGMGIEEGSYVGVLLGRGVELLIANLAVLKSGAAYVPISPDQPEERISATIEDSAMELLLLKESQAAGDIIAGVDILLMDESYTDADWLSEYPDSDLATKSDFDPATPAYVVYTSGSTGKPKGVVVPHAGVVEYCAGAQNRYYTETLTGSFVMTSPAFDLALPGLLLPLLTGGVVEFGGESGDAYSLWRQLLAIRSPRLVRLTPANLQILNDLEPAIECRVPHVFVVGGETLHPRALALLRACFPDSEIYNHYGPSEAIVGCVAMNTRQLNCDEVTSVPIGLPLDNAKLYVLDQALSPVPIGTVGELYVGRHYLALGYLNQPDLTAARFIENPFYDPDDRFSPRCLYKTGDLVQWHDQGLLEFVERQDHQIKIRGFRIELGEIEHVIEQYPAVEQALVIAKSDEQHNKVLIGYYRAPSPMDAVDLKQFVSRLLPEYMTPTYFQHVNIFPVTANGKIDRQALPLPDLSDFSSAYVAPRNETERALCELWQELLKTEKVGVLDNFLLLGGHSLLATRLAAKISQNFGIEILFRDIYNQPVLEAQADIISTALYIKSLEQQRKQGQVKEKGVL
jgi:amino acid adenylation domain-containing protein